nr:MAG TPA: hypothetical protein [Caudoviricetes sp.]
MPAGLPRNTRRRHSSIRSTISSTWTAEVKKKSWPPRDSSLLSANYFS